ncbi:hypothetical protein Ancab_039721 [Ancistrocladus abbreviatus]
MSDSQHYGSVDSRGSSMLDPMDPLFLHPSDHPGMALVSKSFDGTGYGAWKRAMLIALSAKNKIGFVDGSCSRPEEGASSTRHWDRCNDMVISWILNALAKEIAESVLYSNTARQIWVELEDRYGQSNGAKLFQVQKELCSVAQGASDIAGYFTRIKGLWDEWTALNDVSVCTCGAAQHLLKREQDQRLLQFLMGLNENYNITRGNILMMNPLPTVGQAYALLVQEERQREIRASSQVMYDAASFSTELQKGWQQYKNGGKAEVKKSSLVCNYCKKSGHTIDRCYKLHGYPNSKGVKGKKPVAASVLTDPSGIDSDSGEGTQTGSSPIPGFSQEQCNQLLHLLSGMRTNGSSEIKPPVSSPNLSYVNLAGPFTEEATGTW